MDKCSQEEFNICIHNNMCFRCENKSLYKEPKWMEQQKKKKASIKKKKEGLDFEKEVQKKYNKYIKSQKTSYIKNNKKIEPQAAKQQIGSGSLWFAPSDIITENELIECKERGTTTSKGNKTISIQKKWLDKVKYEAALANKKQWYLSFKYKDTDDIYIIKDFEDELAIIQLINNLQEEIKELRGGNDV